MAYEVKVMNQVRRVVHSLFLLMLFLSPLLARSIRAQAADQKTFSSSKDAISGLVSAVRNGSTSDMQAILGPGNEQIVSSGDPVADKNARDSFLKSYDEEHSLVPSKNGEFTLQTGKDAWPLPIPLAHSGGKWYWDGDAAKEEILYRRIGHNELAAIKVCKGVVSAQHDYAISAHDDQPAGTYARHIVSDPGKENGLYWEVKEGEPVSPAGPMLAQAAQEGYDTSGARTPYHGYYYRLLSRANGFALIAYPAEYRSSGVMTFLVNEKGVIYQKDLGDKTGETAQQMTTYSVDKSWQPVR
jgi:hypothetical protein